MDDLAQQPVPLDYITAVYPGQPSATARTSFDSSNLSHAQHSDLSGMPAELATTSGIGGRSEPAESAFSKWWNRIIVRPFTFTNGIGNVIIIAFTWIVWNEWKNGHKLDAWNAVQAFRSDCAERQKLDAELSEACDSALSQDLIPPPVRWSDYLRGSTDQFLLADISGSLNAPDGSMVPRQSRSGSLTSREVLMLACLAYLAYKQYSQFVPRVLRTLRFIGTLCFSTIRKLSFWLSRHMLGDGAKRYITLILRITGSREGHVLTGLVLFLFVVGGIVATIAWISLLWDSVEIRLVEIRPGEIRLGPLRFKIGFEEV